jgi:hypothetical protein
MSTPHTPAPLLQTRAACLEAYNNVLLIELEDAQGRATGVNVTVGGGNINVGTHPLVADSTGSIGAVGGAAIMMGGGDTHCRTG